LDNQGYISDLDFFSTTTYRVTLVSIQWMLGLFFLG